MDLILRNALVNGAATDVGIEDGVIAQLEPHLEGTAKLELDAAGRLTVPDRQRASARLQKRLALGAAGARAEF